jgi:hypothetical protein
LQTELEPLAHDVRAILLAVRETKEDAAKYFRAEMAKLKREGSESEPRVRD